MKILAFSDLHDNDSARKILKKKSELADLVICAGDISIFERNLKSLMNWLAGLKLPTFIIHGNHEEEYILKKMCANYKNLTFIMRQSFLATK